MLIYILKSGACLAILFLFYKLFLEKESMHVFKRFYLLGSLLLSLIIPSIVFTEYVEISEPTTYAPVQYVTPTNEVIGVPPALEGDIIDIEPVLWTVYLLGMLFFGIKFIRNLFQIFNRIRSNPKQRLPRFTQVLLQEKFPPHTFFSYIFLNRKKLEANEIPREVLLHEETHAQQKHSWDVVFVELLHVIFWVNPFVYFTKKSIKLNHEFLADQAVLKKAVDQNAYQNTLLSFLSPDSRKKYQPSLPNAINYSSIKKRFTVMKKQTSKKSALLRSLLLVPLLAIVLYSFTDTKIIHKKNEAVSSPFMDRPLLKTDSFSQNSETEKTSDRSVELAGLILDSETLRPIENVEIYGAQGNLLSKTDDKGYYKMRFADLHKGEIQFEYTLQKKGYKSVEQKEHWGDLQGKIKKTYYFGLQKKESNLPVFTEYMANNTNLSYESILNNFHLVQTRFKFNKKLIAAKKGNQHVLLKIDNSYYLNSDTGWININSKDDPISINNNQVVPASELNNLVERKEITGMTPLADGKALFGIYTIPGGISEIVQDGASRKLMAEYNKLARRYNEMDSNRMTVKKKDVQRLKYIYDLMSDKQRADAEPFPEFPEPPPAPNAPRENDGEASNIQSAPSPPNQKNSWAVTGVANRDSRQDANGTPIPPVAPAVALHEDTKNYSKALKSSLNKYLEQSKALETGVDLYLKKKKGSTEDLWNSYNKAIELYAAYYEIAQKEGKFVKPFQQNARNSSNPPPPPPAQRVLKGQASDIPPPPPAPKAPLDHVIEMAKKGATFYYEGKKVSSDKAIQLMKKNKSLNIQTTQHNTQNPKVKISKEPYLHDQSSNNSQSSNTNVETGNMQINGQTHFYSTKKGVTSYFNRHGQQVDKNGNLLGPNAKQNPTFYYNGQQISSEKAHRLLSNNTSIQVTNEDYSDTEYAIVLTDLNNPNSQNQNLMMHNPNSAIDLTEVISKGAVFFYNDKAISTEKALWLTQNDNIERVQVKEGKNKKPEVYFWKNN